MTLLAVAVSGRGAVDPDLPVVYADDEGYIRGRGAFETLRVYGGRPFRLEEHIARLQVSATRLGLPPLDAEEIAAVGAQALDAANVADVFLRLYATPGRESSGQPVVLALVGALPGDLEEVRARGIGLHAVGLGLDVSGSWPLSGVKSMSYAVNMMAVDEAHEHGADDALFLAQGRVVLECPTSNFWWRRGSELFTPSLDLGILAGVTRAVLVERLPSLGYTLCEGIFEAEVLAGADEAFASSSVREVMPVVTLDGRTIGDGAPGPAARALQEELRRCASSS
jgi:branched-subunit amino acid aminotransferase/4-amino-4-deoxychorismate lyase